ncbi:MAG: hypothetical protein K2X29_09775 [Candidatus Obscuribacterales bacterium]|nr:hypothetical protein [Candidatus Obscuribacterales bacterium]
MTQTITLIRERQLIRLLMSYLIAGLFFMILPGTLLGVWNLFTISGAHTATSAPSAWIQAHGHAQLFGWIGCFILGIGYYSLPNIRRINCSSFADGWLTLLLWSLGIALRWVAQVSLWQWQFLLPTAAVLECLAVAIFLRSCYYGHRNAGQLKKSIEPWALLVIGGSFGMLVATIMNAFQSFVLSWTAPGPLFPQEFTNQFLFVSIWAFVMPIAWGFTAHWMPVFLGLPETRKTTLLLAYGANIVGVAIYFISPPSASALVLLGCCLLIWALRLFERPLQPAKVAGVHNSFPLFIKIAYAWLIVASLLGTWAAFTPFASGVAGAGRHAATVGVLVSMVFSVAPRVLPVFLGRKQVFSTTLMFVSLLLTNIGCLLRVSSEIIAYSNQLSPAWLLLPLSAVLELIGISIFTFNMIATFAQSPLLPCGSSSQPGQSSLSQTHT